MGWPVVGGAERRTGAAVLTQLAALVVACRLPSSLSRRPLAVLGLSQSGCGRRTRACVRACVCTPGVINDTDGHAGQRVSRGCPVGERC